jgi:hypothetical protein
VKSQASPWYSALQGDFDQVDYNGDLMSSGGDGELSSWQPQWPFGFGLSYTAFAVAPLGVGVQGSAVVASCNVTNVGAAAAKNGQRKKHAFAIFFGISTIAFFQFDEQLLRGPLQD